MKNCSFRGVLLIATLSLPLAIPAALAQESQVDASLEYYAPGELLGNMIRETIDVNPRLQAALSDYSAALERVPQVTSLPDPMVTFTKFVRSPETRVGPQTSSVMLSQNFPWFGKLDLNGKIALRQASAGYEHFRALEREVVASVKDSFYELAYLDQVLEVTAEEQLLLEYYEELAETRYATGEGLQFAVIRIQAEITRLLNQLEILRRQRESAVGRLNTLRRRPTGDPIPPLRLRDLVPAEVEFLNLQQLYATGEANRPELRAMLDDLERHELTMERARKNNWPDITLSAGVVQVDGREDLAGVAQPPPDNGKNAFSFSIGFNIPIWRDRYDAAEREAGEQRSGTLERYRAAVDEMQFAIRDEVLRIETLERQMSLYNEVLVPQAESALESAETAYETGLVGSTELLDSERVLLDIRLAQARFSADHLQALARLELALGTRFPNL